MAYGAGYRCIMPPYPGRNVAEPANPVLAGLWMVVPPRAPGNVIFRWMAELTSNRVDEAFEFGGLLIFGAFVWMLLRRRLLVPFLIYGDLEKSNSKHVIRTSKNIKNANLKP